MVLQQVAQHVSRRVHLHNRGDLDGNMLDAQRRQRWCGAGISECGETAERGISHIAEGTISRRRIHTWRAYQPCHPKLRGSPGGVDGDEIADADRLHGNIAVFHHDLSGTWIASAHQIKRGQRNMVQIRITGEGEIYMPWCPSNMPLSFQRGFVLHCLDVWGCLEDRHKPGV